MSNGLTWLNFLYLGVAVRLALGSTHRQHVFAKKKKDSRLPGFVISTEKTSDLFECSFKCLINEVSKCTSFNFQKLGDPRHICEMNNITKSMSSLAKDDELFDYYEMLELKSTELAETHQGERFRLDDTKIGVEQGLTSEECIEMCTRDKCCTSANFVKYDEAHICEMFQANDSEMKGHRVPDDTSDHFIFNTAVKEISDTCRPKTACRSALFPSNNILHYMKTKDVRPDITAITCCFWLKWTREDLSAHFLTYAKGDEDNIFGMMSHNRFFSIFVNENNRFTTSTKNIADGEWHTLCTTWRSVGGAYSLHGDGIVEHTGVGLAENEVLPGGGTWVAGHDQDEEGGGFNPNQMLVGEIAEINIWDHALPYYQIKIFSDFCSPVLRGNVKSWPDFIVGASDTIVLVNSPQCCRRNNAQSSTNYCEIP